MNDQPAIRVATESDAGEILEIYAPFVVESAVSFELEPPSQAEMRGRIAKTLERFPWLVCVGATGRAEVRGGGPGGIAGYAYASLHRERAAYQWCVEVSAYVRPDSRRTGVARALYTSLFEILRAQGFFNAYAGIALPGPASVGFHEAMGFRPVGIYGRVGYKHGAWRDVGWWHLTLREHGPDPAVPVPFAAIRDSEACALALASGERLLARSPSE